MQSFAHSLVTLLHIAFNSDKVTMENHLQHNVIERQKESEYRLIHKHTQHKISLFKRKIQRLQRWISLQTLTQGRLVSRQSQAINNMI